MRPVNSRPIFLVTTLCSSLPWPRGERGCGCWPRRRVSAHARSDHAAFLRGCWVVAAGTALSLTTRSAAEPGSPGPQCPVRPCPYCLNWALNLAAQLDSFFAQLDKWLRKEWGFHPWNLAAMAAGFPPRSSLSPPDSCWIDGSFPDPPAQSRRSEVGGRRYFSGYLEPLKDTCELSKRPGGSHRTTHRFIPNKPAGQGTSHSHWTMEDSGPRMGPVTRQICVTAVRAVPGFAGTSLSALPCRTCPSSPCTTSAMTRGALASG